MTISCKKVEKNPFIKKENICRCRNKYLSSKIIPIIGGDNYDVRKT